MGSKQGQYKIRTTHVDRHVETVVGIHAKSSDSSFFCLNEMRTIVM